MELRALRICNLFSLTGNILSVLWNRIGKSPFPNPINFKDALHKLETLEIKTNDSRLIYLEGLELPVLLIKQVFQSEDGKTAVQYLISSDTTLLPDDIIRSYHKRWRVEEYHKSLKQNVSLEKSPTQTLTTQTNHFFAALCGDIKLERLKIKTKHNHFALKSKLYLKALTSAFQTLRQLNQDHLSA